MKEKIIIKFLPFSLLMLCMVFAVQTIQAQGIRMHYEEMTDLERDDLMAAYFTSGGPSGTSGTVASIANFHNANFSTIHFNTAPNDVFFSWHRRASQELERDLKDLSGNEWIVIPYWNWSLSQLKTDDLWQSDWLGPFDTPWNLNRLASSGVNMNLAAQVATALTETNFYQFSRFEIEGDDPHINGHIWTGGTMASGNSPKDPVFFFHHNMVDKIWADWYEIHDDPALPDNYYINTTLPRYPGEDPDDYNDPRSLGIFYADAGLAVLDRYTVSNTHTTSEKFGYQYVIEAGGDFVIPSGNDAEFRSCNEIIMVPGFLAAAGSSFQAKIDADCAFNTAALVGKDDPPSGQAADREEAARDFGFATARNFPNPFTTSTTIAFSLKAETVLSIEVTSVTGQRIALLHENERFSPGEHQMVFDASDLPKGIYLCNLRDENGISNHIKLVKQ